MNFDVRKKKFSDLPRRIFSGSIFAFLSLSCIFLGGLVATLFLGVCLGILCWEVFYIFSSGHRRLTLPTLIMPSMLFFVPVLKFYDFYPNIFLLSCALIVFFISDKNFLKMFCVFYISISILMFQEILQSDDLEGNLYHLLFILVAVMASDIGGYFFGKFFGGRKIFEAISPNKTWSGSLGGIILAIICSMALSPFVEHSFFLIGIYAVFLSIAAQSGDFFESWLKRKFKVKDSGVLLPGHGGLFDRLDGLLAAVPIYMGSFYVL